ncbi:unnamed protein product [Caenorhabditis sp. 36 PRJEB53466]|nr:unnamed protein product [Caenorhabditis sp. 36 PRJEB53466]
MTSFCEKQSIDLNDKNATSSDSQPNPLPVTSFGIYEPSGNHLGKIIKKGKGNDEEQSECPKTEELNENGEREKEVFKKPKECHSPLLKRMKSAEDSKGEFTFKKPLRRYSPLWRKSRNAQIRMTVL